MDLVILILTVDMTNLYGLCKVSWNEHLVSYYPLKYYYGINTNILYLTFSRAIILYKILIITRISNEKTN